MKIWISTIMMEPSVFTFTFPDQSTIGLLFLMFWRSIFFVKVDAHLVLLFPCLLYKSLTEITGVTNEIDE